MSTPYIVELNAVALFFSLALSAFLFILRRRAHSIRPSFLHLLMFGSLVCAAEVVNGLLYNYSISHPPGFSFLTVSNMLVEVLELANVVFYMRYIVDLSGDEQRGKKVLLPFYGILIVLTAVQLFNVMTGFFLRITGDGVMHHGTGMYFISYIIPFGTLTAVVVIYFILIPKELPSRRFAVLSTYVLLLVAVLIQVVFAPQLTAVGFAVVVSDFIIYFIYETPPFKQLQEKIVQLEEAAQLAEEAKAKAMEEDRGMNDFLANMSHEIRTPLTAILGYNEVILMDAQEEDVQDYAMDIANAGNSLLHIVNDILDFSRIESGEITLAGTEYLLTDVLDNIENMIRKKAGDKGLEYRRQIDEKTPNELFGDSVRVGQILINLLNNAVKYTRRGFVELRIREEKDRRARDRIVLHAEVVDSGIGIRDKDAAKLFERFARLDTEKNRSIEGSGLGLEITSRYLKLMGGSITFKSIYGEGSTFIVEIPQEITGTRTVGDYESGVMKRIRRHTEILAPDAKVLVVDDNETNRTVAKELLRDTLVQVDLADSGAACLEVITEESYDLILLDQMMPNLSGPETLAYMKAMKDNKSAQARVIAFTADAIAGARERLLAQGFDDYVSKPVTRGDLCGLLYRHLPEDKLLMPGMKGYDEAKSREDALHREQEKSEAQTMLERLEGIDLAEALSICGTKEVLLAAVRDFYLTIDQQADLIEQYLAADDLANYTIKVHALKSAARFIGARKLSEDAAALEELGNRKEKTQIEERTPELLSMYRAYKKHLSAIDPDANAGEEDPREEISSEELAEALSEMKAFVDDFDFDGVDAVLEALEAYRMPESEAERFKKIRLAVTNVDREELLKLL
ncbi:MAG: response regulator [Lachnospiraceae bacterium]|nr:response regulator [Lachnospiraceae bacterium]